MAKSDQDQRAVETEESLLERARTALSQCNWVVGECAARWTEKYARGRTDADFGSQVGLSGDQIFQRRRVWETFHDVRDEYSQLKWSHFYVALNWEDSAECFSWAEENKATVAEMRAWRRSVHGEDLTTEADPLGIQVLDYAPTSIHEPEAVEAFAGDVPFEPTRSGSGSAEQTPYSPYRKEARGEGNFESEEEGAVTTREPIQETPERVLKRAVSTLRRTEVQLALLSEHDYQQADPALLNQLWDVLDDLQRAIKRRD
ncbi:MAG: hypothetical protein KDA78_03425 [Planctomycetaceae bacterium]|nr:hypothetical protein [Planctomycetaceae bacterium]